MMKDELAELRNRADREDKRLAEKEKRLAEEEASGKSELAELQGLRRSRRLARKAG